MSAWLNVNKQRAAVVLCVCALHAVVLYAMHAGLLRSEPIEIPVMISNMALLEAAPTPRKSTAAPQVPTKPKTVAKSENLPAKPLVRNQALPILQTQNTQVAQAVTPFQTAQTTPVAPNKTEPVVTPTVTATGATSDHVGKAAVPPPIELPSTNASYLNNPKPPYPAMSNRLGEKGQVMLRVFINTEGRPGEVQLLKSSGFDRLDRTAIETVKRWRFVPGKRGGVPEAMWFNVPIDFDLN